MELRRQANPPFIFPRRFAKKYSDQIVVAVSASVQGGTKPSQTCRTCRDNEATPKSSQNLGLFLSACQVTTNINGDEWQQGVAQKR